MGEFAHNMQELSRLDPEGTRQRFGPYLDAYRNMQDRAIEKHFDLESAQQDAMIVKSGLAGTEQAKNRRSRLLREKLQTKMDMENRVELMANELKQQALQNEQNNLQSARGLSQDAVQEREQEIQRQLAETQQNINANQQAIDVQNTNAQLDLQDEQNQIAVDQN